MSAMFWGAAVKGFAGRAGSGQPAAPACLFAAVWFMFAATDRYGLQAAMCGFVQNIRQASHCQKSVVSSPVRYKVTPVLGSGKREGRYRQVRQYGTQGQY